ncbi:MAG: DEAD/DEAH box helicase [Deltaproteobacteria bacterium]|nr:DEAD/DEAH box helicase [Deltaproteobacteria bacterium]
MTTSPGGRPDPATASQNTRFDDLPLSDEARAGLRSLGYEVATSVQAASFGPVMAGKDVVVQSKTGTGKTTAFGLPLIERIKDGLIDPQVLVLCPTRELAVQVSEELAELGDAKGVRVLPIYGGTPMGPQLAGLKSGCDVIVGTPGRVLDHIRRRSLRLVHVHHAVLDEADEMLSMGFWDEVTAILDKLPTERQTLLFSATLPDQIRKAAAKYLRTPERLDLSRDELTVEGIKNIIYERDDRLPKPRNLLYVLEAERPESAIIFCNTRDDTGVVAAYLRRQGHDALALSGELGQKERERIMSRMKRGDLQFLVATDIAARGIDISDLPYVVNYSLPDFTEVYIHRVGRTGRIGKSGTAVSLVGGQDEMTATELERNFGIQFEKRTLPPREELDRLRAERLVAQIIKVARETEITGFMPVADHLRRVDGGVEVVAFLLKKYFTELEDQREATARADEARRTKEAEAELRARDRSEHGEAAAEVKAPAEAKRRRGRADDRPREGAPVASESSLQPARETWRLFVNRGKSDGYEEAKVAALLVEVAGQGDTAQVDRVELRRSHAFVEAVPALAEKAVEAAARGLTREDKPLIVERARTR